MGGMSVTAAGNRQSQLAGNAHRKLVFFIGSATVHHFHGVNQLMFSFAILAQKRSGF